jgi:hypothetical protein
METTQKRAEQSLASTNRAAMEAFQRPSFPPSHCTTIRSRPGQHQTNPSGTGQVPLPSCCACAGLPQKPATVSLTQIARKGRSLITGVLIQEPVSVLLLVRKDRRAGAGSIDDGAAAGGVVVCAAGSVPHGVGTVRGREEQPAGDVAARPPGRLRVRHRQLRHAAVRGHHARRRRLPQGLQEGVQAVRRLRPLLQAPARRPPSLPSRRSRR